MNRTFYDDMRDVSFPDVRAQDRGRNRMLSLALAARGSPRRIAGREGAATPNISRACVNGSRNSTRSPRDRQWIEAPPPR